MARVRPDRQPGSQRRSGNRNKSGKIRRVPLPDQAVAALNDLSTRGDFTSPDELVVCNIITGRILDGSALHRRYKDAQAAAGVHEMRWRDLRHTYGSLLAASGEELVTIKDGMSSTAWRPGEGGRPAVSKDIR